MSDRSPSLRERKRAMTIAEIKNVALAQLAAEANAELSLRGVARELGITVQSLYHYFPSRDDLITALVTDAHDALADAVDGAGRASAHLDAQARLVEAGLAYRAWAVRHRARFLLIYGNPVPGYHAPDPGPTTDAARRLGAAFVDIVFAGWTPEELSRVPVPHPVRDLTVGLAAAARMVAPVLPGTAFALFIEKWALLHGLVMLEVLEHLPWLGDEGTRVAFYRNAMERLAGELAALRTALSGRDGSTDHHGQAT